MKISIDSTMEYAKRIMAVISVEMPDKTYKIGMYRSSGSNVNGQGVWFPTAGSSMGNPSERHPAGRAMISKDLIINTGDSLYKLPTIIDNKRDHANAQARLTAFDRFGNGEKRIFSFDLEEVSAAVSMKFNEMESKGQIQHAPIVREGMSENQIFESITDWIVNEVSDIKPKVLPSYEMSERDNELQDTRIQFTR